jgi:hypothetical protein
MTAGPKPEPGSGEADYSPRKAMQLHRRVLLKTMESRPHVHQERTGSPICLGTVRECLILNLCHGTG